MRTPVTVKIKFKSASLDQFIDRYAVDVSNAGIFIRTPKPLSVGTNLDFEFQLQDGSPLLNGNGTVVWIRDKQEPEASPGMGVRFDTLPNDSQEILQQLLDRKDDAQAFGQPPDEPPMAPPPEEEMAIDLPEPPAAAKPEAEPIKPAVTPEPKPAKKEPKEEYRKENLDRIFDEADVAKAPEPDLGVKPLTEPAKPKRPPKTTEPSRPEPTARPVDIEENTKSSGFVWILILLALGGAGFLYYKYQYAPKHQALQPDQGVVTPAPVVPPPTPKISMEVKSEPEGARIWVNGAPTGKVTPSTLMDLDPTKQIEIALDLAGKKLHKEQIKPSEKLYSRPLTEDSERSIRISSEPMGATIYLNRKKIGTTPMKLEQKLNFKRSYNVKLVLDGYQAAEGKFVPDDLEWKRDDLDEIGTFSLPLVRQGAKAVDGKVDEKVDEKVEKKKPRRKTRRRPRKKKTPVRDEPAAPPPTKTEKPKEVPDRVPDTKAPPAKAPEPPAKKEGGIKKPTWSD